MKIAFPVQEDRGMESLVHNHFGSARLFIWVDTRNNQVETIVNKDANHAHGQCQPLRAISEKPVDATAVGGIGAGALQKLQAAGIKVFRAIEGSVGENIELINAGRLPKFTLNQTCGGHSALEGCVH